MPDRPPPDVSHDLYALVVYLHASCNRDLLDAIAAEQLSFNQLQLLERLRGGRRKPTMRQAAAQLHVTQAATTRLVDALARRGLVQREPDERDYRAKRVVITDRGEEVITRLHAARLDRIIAFAQGLSAGEREALERGLAKVVQRESIAACRPAA